MNNAEFLRQNFDKLLLLAVLSVFCLLVIHFSHHPGADSKALDFSLQAASGVLGALITLLQTSRVAERKTDIPPDTRQVKSRTETVETTEAKVVTDEKEKP